MARESWREDRMLGTLTVEVCKVWDLKNMASFGKMNPQVSIAVNRDKQHTRTIDGGGVACEFHQTLTFPLDCQSTDVVYIKVNHKGVMDKCVGVFSVTLEEFIDKVQCKRVRIQLLDEHTLSHPTGMIELIPDYHGTNDPMPDAVRSPPVQAQERAGLGSAPTAALSYPTVAAAASPAIYSSPPSQPVYQPQYASAPPQQPQQVMYHPPSLPAANPQYYSQGPVVQQPVWSPPQFQQSPPVYGQPMQQPMQPYQQQGGWQPQMYQSPPQQPQRAGPPIAYPVHAAQPQPPH